MEPVSPVIPGMQSTIYALAQPEYKPLAVIKDINGKRLSRFTFSEEERKLIAEGADLFTCIWAIDFQPPINLLVCPIQDIDASCNGVLGHFDMGQIVVGVKD